MKVIYIAHPISGNIRGNLKKIRDIARKINLTEPDVVPFAHYYLDCHCLDDNDPQERARGIKNDEALFEKGFIDEVRLYGNRISDGMVHEINRAKKHGIIVIPMTTETKNEWKFYSMALGFNK